MQPSMLITFLLVFARVSAAVATAPIFEDRMIAVQVKIGFSAIIALVLTPGQMKVVRPIASSPAAFVMLVGEQVLLGLAFALIFTVIYRSAEAAGQIIGQQTGVTLAEINSDNNSGLQAIGQLYHITAGLIFLGLDGHHWLILGLGSSFNAMPVTAVILDQHLAQVLLSLGAAAFQYAIGLALPLMAALLMADVVTGLIGRSLPSLNLFVLGLPLKIALALVIIFISAPFLVSVCQQIFQQIPHLALWR